MSLEKNDLEIRYRQLARQIEMFEKEMVRIEQILLSLDEYDIKKRDYQEEQKVRKARNKPLAAQDAMSICQRGNESERDHNEQHTPYAFAQKQMTTAG